MKPTKKQMSQLDFVLQNLERAERFLMKDYIAIARKGGLATTTLHYTRADGATLYELRKEYGSDLTGLQSGIQALKSFMRVHDKNETAVIEN